MPSVIAWIVSVFKGIFLDALAPILDTGILAAVVNDQIEGIVASQEGQLKMGVFQILLDVLPQNDIKVPANIGIDYSGLDNWVPYVSNGRIYGYFDGKVENMPQRDWITNMTYQANGNLNLDSETESPFVYQVSSSIINNMM